MARTKEKMKHYTKKACALLLVAAIFCGAFSINAFAYTSFNGIEMIKNSADEFVILEIVPEVNSGSIGFYVAGQESTSAAVANEDEYNEKVNNLTAAGLYKADGTAPLSPSQRIYPWKTVPSSAVKITLDVSETIEVRGTFTENTGAGAFDFESENNYKYVETGGDYDFVEESTGELANISYNNYYVSEAYTNNNWFKSFVLGDENSLKTIKVNSFTPNNFSANEADANSLTAQIASADLIVISAGLSIASPTVTSLENSYGANDLTVAQAKIIEDAVNGGKAIVLDSRIENVEKTATGGETEPTNIATLTKALISDSNAVNGFVRGNVYCFTPDASRAHLATGGFNLDFGDALTNAETAPYYEVYSAIKNENELRKQALSGDAPADYYMPEEISIAAAIRQIISLSFNAKEPVIQITDSTGENEMSNILIPTIYRDSSAAGADTLLLTDGNKNINIKLQDENEIKRQMELFVYYEHNDGEYYLSTDGTGKKTMLAIDTKTPSGAQRYLLIPISNNTAIESATTGANAINLQITYSLPNEIFIYFEALSQNNLSVYLGATTTIGFEQYSALSNELNINKLGLFMIG